MIECVPNFSEGRRPEVIGALAAAARAAGARVLGTHADAAHHRSVVTFCGEPEVLERAAFDVVRLAAQKIDLTGHRGRHPRIGAADVVPFVPLAGHAMGDAVQLARRVGRRIGEELEIPVFLYGHAATHPRRRNLPDVRRGQFEGLRASIGADPSRRPDFGPARVHPTAGAVAVGARPILIAFNIDLETDDAAPARRIARSVRERDGGLAGIRALGFFHDERGCAQVSLNVCDYGATSLRQVFEAVVALAAREGIRVRSSEIVGLAPAAALPPEWIGPLKLRGFDPLEQILENKLASPQA
jgi:glutamate formiminotransferase